MKENTRNLLILHFIVFIWGWTAVLGKIITLPALQLIWIRVMIAFAGILIYVLIKGIPLFSLQQKTVLQLLAIGLLVGLHWICFYGAVKASNVSVTLACFSTGTLFTSLLEPIFFKRKVLWYEIFFGLVVIGALLLIFNVETKYFWGILLGIGAALTSSMMAVVNSIMSRRGISSGLISVYEMVGCWACISIFIFSLDPTTATVFGVSAHDWLYILIFAVGCTVIPFIIGVYILKKVSPYTMSLTLNLETIYGILFAFFIFGNSEHMSASFYIGTAIILAVVFADVYMKRFVK
jgi:drug/metabolite transporter (DMT)-like permease